MKNVLLFAFLLPTLLMAQSSYSDSAMQIFEQGNSAFQSGELTEAFGFYQKAVAMEPEYAEAYINMSSIKFQEKAYDESLELARKAYNIEKVQYTILSQLGKAYYMNGYYDSAVFCLERVEIFKPASTEEQYFLAAAKVGAGNFSDAKVVANKLYNSDPNNSDYNVLMGNVNFGLGAYDKAMENYNKAIELSPESKYIYSNIANNYIKLGESEKAIDYIDKGVAATEGREKISFLVLKGNYYKSIDDLENAEKTFNEAFDIQPNNVSVIVNQAAVLIDMEKYESAIEKCNAAIELDNQSKEAFFNRGIAKEMTRKVKEACEDWEEAFILGSEKAEVFLNSPACNE